jgi:hypothetical protein
MLNSALKLTVSIQTEKRTTTHKITIERWYCIESGHHQGLHTVATSDFVACKKKGRQRPHIYIEDSRLTYHSVAAKLETPQNLASSFPASIISAPAVRRSEPTEGEPIKPGVRDSDKNHD